jgi:uncharacterized lipoprotein YehR (DUF1307 family)
MRKLFSLTIALGLIFAISSCKKYDEGPGFSLRSKAERVANTWKFDKVTEADGDDVTSSYTGWTMVLDKDGGMTMNYVFLSIPYSDEGTWAFASDNEEIHLTYTNALLESLWPKEFTIKKLKEKEFWVVAKTDNTEFQFAP